MKVMLIDPPGYKGLKIGRILGSFGTNKSDQAWPPYDLQIMAGYCKKNGHDFKIIEANNLNKTPYEIEFEIKRYMPDWVIYTTSFPTFRLDAQIANIAKRVSKNIKTACMTLSIFSVQDPVKRMEEFPDLDFIHWGEPELPLMKLINGESPKKVKGIYYRDKNNKIKFTGFGEKIEDLDELGVPVHSALPYKIYKGPVAIRLPMAIVNCSRGCTNQCVHCQSVFQKPLRFRSIKNVLQEMDEIHSLGIREIKFYDCSLLDGSSYVKELCQKMIDKKYGFSWDCNSRAEFINQEILKCMKKAGCHTIGIGCESSNPEILRNMKKNESVEQIESAVRMIKKEGIRVLMYLTFGLEGETEETMRSTFNFAKKLNPEFVTFGIVVPAPGTSFYRSLKEKGYLTDKELELQDPNALPAFTYPHLAPEKIHEFTRSAYRRYYFRPGYVVTRLKGLRSLTELKMSFAGALSVVKRYCFEEVK